MEHCSLLCGYINSHMYGSLFTYKWNCALFVAHVVEHCHKFCTVKVECCAQNKSQLVQKPVRGCFHSLSLVK